MKLNITKKEKKTIKDLETALQVNFSQVIEYNLEKRCDQLLLNRGFILHRKLLIPHLAEMARQKRRYSIFKTLLNNASETEFKAILCDGSGCTVKPNYFSKNRDHDASLIQQVIGSKHNTPALHQMQYSYNIGLLGFCCKRTVTMGDFIGRYIN